LGKIKGGNAKSELAESVFKRVGQDYQARRMHEPKCEAEKKQKIGRNFTSNL